MSAFVNPFVSGRHRRLAETAIWLAFALALLAAGAALGRAELGDLLEHEAKQELVHFDKQHDNLSIAFEDLARSATAEPCSPDFMREMHRVAFRPDGLNEFIYAPGGMVTCSTSIARQDPRSLGPPDIEASANGGTAVWVNRNLDEVGLKGVRGSVVLRDPFAIVIAQQGATTAATPWIARQLVLSAADDRVWHVGGTEGLYAAATGTPKGLFVLHESVCGEKHAYCAAVRADLWEVIARWRTELLIAVALICFYAVWPASVTYRALERYWSLEQRFLRNLDAKSIICAYQPILDLRTGEISGCEVLARWRDVDGSLVFPDKFIDFVASSARTLAFTRMVAERAFDELSRTLPPSARLQVNFNIFPRDLNSTKLHDVFRVFDAARDRFQLALEIVESNELSIETAQREIECLRRLGMRTYIDDFGSGYSNIHRVASLSINGVKLDRSFAMAPSESLMARILSPALDMVASTGCEVVVEGVETKERLDFLLSTTSAAFAQGYYISRPLSIEGFAQFLADHDAETLLERRMKAAA